MKEEKLVCEKCNCKRFYLMLYKEDTKSEGYSNYDNVCINCGVHISLVQDKKPTILKQDGSAH